MSKRTLLLLAAGVIVVLLVLRDAGVISVNLHWIETSTEFRSDWGDDARFPKAQSSSIRVQFDEAGEPKPIDAVRVSAASPTADVLVRVEPFEIEGCAWRPLYKHCACRFRAKVTRNGLEWGSLEGTIDLSVKGSAPARIVRETLREEIRKHATKTVRTWLKP